MRRRAVGEQLFATTKNDRHREDADGVDHVIGEQRVHEFQNILIDSGIPAFIRRPRGRDIYAACGQLKRTTELVTIG